MADLTQSSATTATTTPQYYTDYISNLASKGTAAGNTAQYVGAQPLQTQAFDAAASNVGNYQPALANAGNLIGQGAATDITGAANPYLTAGTTTSGLSAANPYLTAGASGSDTLVGNYMNPYVTNVVDQIRQANQQNIAQNLSPNITAGAVGGGQFGSQRGANALSLGISNANIGALGEQTKALQSGYAQALQAAQAQRSAQLQAGQTAGTLQNAYNTNQVQAGQVAGNLATQQAQNLRDAATANLNLGTQTQNQGIADVNQLATMGAQQQQILQNQQLFPLDVLAKQAGVLSGAQIPTTQTQTMTGSPLSAIAGLGSLGVAMTQSGVNGSPSALQNLINQYNGVTANSKSPTGYVDGTGAPVNKDGTPVSGMSSTPTAAELAAWANTSSAGTDAPPGGGSGDFQAADGQFYSSQSEADAASAAFYAANPP